MNLVSTALLVFCSVCSPVFGFSQRVVVGAERMNVAYIGVPNEMNIQVHGVRSSRIEVSVQSGQLSGAGTHYVWYPDSLGVNEVKVCRRRWGKAKEIQSFNIRVKRLPEPQLTFAGISSGYLTRRDLLSSPKPIATCFNFDYDLRFLITGFSVSIYRNGDVPFFHKVYYQKSGLIFDESIREVFSHLHHGDRLSFSEIVCMRSDGKAVIVPDANFVVAN